MIWLYYRRYVAYVLRSINCTNEYNYMMQQIITIVVTMLCENEAEYGRGNTGVAQDRLGVRSLRQARARPVGVCQWAHRDDAAHCWLFFFFQAEDGIRDLTVTGVQTCALPI